MRKIAFITVAALLLSLTGCASHPDEVTDQMANVVQPKNPNVLIEKNENPVSYPEKSYGEYFENGNDKTAGSEGNIGDEKLNEIAESAADDILLAIDYTSAAVPARANIKLEYLYEEGNYYVFDFWYKGEKQECVYCTLMEDDSEEWYGVEYIGERTLYEWIYWMFFEEGADGTDAPYEDGYDYAYASNEKSPGSYEEVTFNQLFRSDDFIGRNVCIVCSYVTTIEGTDYCIIDGNYIMTSLSYANIRVAYYDKIKIFGTYKGLQNDPNHLVDSLQTSSGVPFIAVDHAEYID